jgi:YHS domain-containing protein
MRFLLENWWYLLLVAGFGYMMMKGGGCCGGGHSHSSHNHTEHTGNSESPNSNNINNQIEMVLDPVCGMYIYPETAIKENINGKTYYFCSENCKRSFISKHQRIAG